MDRRSEYGTSQSFNGSDYNTMFKGGETMNSNGNNIDREMLEICQELKELLPPHCTINLARSSDEELDVIDIETPEWIKLMDDVLTDRDFECDLISPGREGYIKLHYLREKDIDWYVGEREGDGIYIP